MKKLMILDGNSIANRGFYGVRPLSAPDGTPTNAIFGFLTIFQRILNEIRPDAVAVTFDEHEKTFRHLAFDYYKAQRKGMPEELAVQMPILREVLTEMGLKIYSKSGYEADDILGTAGRICTEQGWECVIVTGDRDSLQLVSNSVTVCLIKTRAGQTETTLYTPAVFEAEYAFAPRGIIDLKALMGDSSDNIPGVPGIGEKTANDLIRTFGSLQAVYENIESEKIRESVRKKLLAGEQSARDSYWLATILCDVPMDLTPANCLWDHDYAPGLYDLMLRLGFRKLIEKLDVKEPKNAPVSSVAEAWETVAVTDENAGELREAIHACEYVSFASEAPSEEFRLSDGKKIYSVCRNDCFQSYDALLDEVLSAGVKKVTQNLKQLLHDLIKENCPAEGFVFDTALAEYLISSIDSDYSETRLSLKYLGQRMEGVQALWALYEPMQRKLRELSLTELYEKAELPLCRVLAEMELTGFLVDRTALKAFGESLTGDIDALQKSIWQEAGQEFNILSPKQLGEILFETLQLPFGKKTKTGWSTNADTLEKLRPYHPIVEHVLDYRMLTKLKSTYADGLLKVIEADGRIHTSFQMTVTATGRLSSTEPNLQNIPIRRELGAQIRGMFIAPPGKVLVDADYSQIELRLMAHIADDKAMQEAFLSGEDFHRVTASNVFHVPLEDVTSSMRSRAKAVNFGIVYGISAFSLAQDIGVLPKEAKAYMDAYFDQFTGVKAYMENIVKQAEQDGYVTTLYGRRRDIPELKDSKHAVREFGKRVALNMPVQGTAADIMKLAMIEADRRLKAEKLQARLVLQVHDELIVECPAEEEDTVRRILTESMEHAASLKVPLLVEAKSGHSWSEAH